MKAAAPQALQTTRAAKSGKTAARAKPALPTSATGFDRALARAVAAKAAGPAATARAAAPQSPALLAGHEQTADTPLAKSPGRVVARPRARGRTDEAPAAERTGAEVSRTLPTAGSATAAGAAAPAQSPSAAPTAKRAEPRIQVVDLRKKAAVTETPDAARNGGKASAEKVDGGNPPAKQFSERLAVQPKPAAAAPARATPLERLREMTGSDLVKTAGLIVRDGGGEIRLTLKPESLGSVRIRLHLEDGKVEGRIVVDTPEARRAFEAGIEGLTRALQADGFQTGALQVSVSGGNANDSRQAAGLLGDTIAAARLREADGLSAGAAIVSGWTGDGLVNVYA